MKSFFDYWPLHNYLFLSETNKLGKKLYYDRLDDEFIQEEEALEREKKDDYRNSTTYWISGPRKLINEVYKDLTDKYLPQIPLQTLKNMEEKRKRNPIFQKFNVCGVTTRKEAEKKANIFSKLPREIVNENIFIFLKIDDILNINILNKSFKDYCEDVNMWNYLLMRDFKHSPIDDFISAKQLYSNLAVTNIENQYINHSKVTNWSNKVWKPRIGNYVTIQYRQNYESIVYLVTAITKNEKNQVIHAHLIPYSVKHQRKSLVNDPVDIKLYTCNDPKDWLQDRWVSSKNKTKVGDVIYPGKQIEKDPQQYEEDKLQKIYSVLGYSGLDLYYRYKQLSDELYKNKTLNFDQEKEFLSIYSQIRHCLH